MRIPLLSLVLASSVLASHLAHAKLDVQKSQRTKEQLIAEIKKQSERFANTESWIYNPFHAADKHGYVLNPLTLDDNSGGGQGGQEAVVSADGVTVYTHDVSSLNIGYNLCPEEVAQEFTSEKFDLSEKASYRKAVELAMDHCIVILVQNNVGHHFSTGLKYFNWRTGKFTRYDDIVVEAFPAPELGEFDYRYSVRVENGRLVVKGAPEVTAKTFIFDGTTALTRNIDDWAFAGFDYSEHGVRYRVSGDNGEEVGALDGRLIAQQTFVPKSIYWSSDPESRSFNYRMIATQILAPRNDGDNGAQRFGYDARAYLNRVQVPSIETNNVHLKKMFAAMISSFQAEIRASQKLRSAQDSLNLTRNEYRKLRDDYRATLNAPKEYAEKAAHAVRGPEDIKYIVRAMTDIHRQLIQLGMKTR